MTLASRIDHTLLRAEAAEADVRRVIDEAREHGFASVCVNGAFVAGTAARLRGSPVRTCAVAGFPLGAMKATLKAIESAAAVKDGADEIDFVAHLPHLLACDLEATRAECIEIVRAARAARADVVVKVIIESALLLADTDGGEARIAAACRAAREGGCDFVKTSSGLHPAGGATAEAVALMKKHADGLRVKAAGGIRTREDAQRMLDAGADRIGCSASVAIVAGRPASGGY